MPRSRLTEGDPRALVSEVTPEIPVRAHSSAYDRYRRTGGSIGLAEVVPDTPVQKGRIFSRGSTTTSTSISTSDASPDFLSDDFESSDLSSGAPQDATLPMSEELSTHQNGILLG
jgi:hypothetical protein